MADLKVARSGGAMDHIRSMNQISDQTATMPTAIASFRKKPVESLLQGFAFVPACFRRDRHVRKMGETLNILGTRRIKKIGREQLGIVRIL